MNVLRLFLLIALLNCGKSAPDVQSLVVQSIVQNCTEQVECVIEMPGTIPFAWDKLYVFRAGILDVEITEMIGKKVEFPGEFSNKYVFLLNDKVVFTEEHHINFDRFADGTVMFAPTDEDVKFALIDKNSRLSVRIERSKSRTTYYLTCDNCGNSLGSRYSDL